MASLGGPYPNGDVRHTYGAPADVQVRIDVTYGGQFSVGGGEWIDIPDVVTIQGTPFALRVAEARAQPVADASPLGSGRWKVSGRHTAR